MLNVAWVPGKKFVLANSGNPRKPCFGLWSDYNECSAIPNGEDCVALSLKSGATASDGTSVGPQQLIRRHHFKSWIFHSSF